MTRFSNYVLAPAAALLVSLGVAGCQAEHPDVIPTSATMSVAGQNELRYTAPSDGTIYVYDKPNNRLLWSGKVLQGQVVQVDSGKNAILLNGSVAANKTLQLGDRNEIWFDPTPTAMTTGSTLVQPAGSTVVQPAGSTVSGSNSVTVTPTVTVQHGSDTAQPASGSVIVSPELKVSPTTQPTGASQ